ncbi:MAG: hypothetical protein PWP27_1937 [Clostridiales bacterium]|jgi:uncharacterized protein YlxW (UPF0749 family)|nr:hypothetical protein [Clostridiales bacterium]MDK2934127.1 hypothetical protein [Clostridiales bacterium]
MKGETKMKNIKFQIAVACICIILGLVIALQVKSVKTNNRLLASHFGRSGEAQAELNKAKEKNQDLYNQLLQYENDLRKYQKSTSQNSEHIDVLKKQLENAKMAAGLTDLKGTGIIITVDDSNLRIENADTNSFTVSDIDILKIVNDLKDAGAEAISINGERLVAISEIRTTGPIISINNTRHSTPLTIKAIGNSDTLAAVLNLRGGAVDVLKQWGIDVTTKKSDKVFIPGYDEDIYFNYAVPVVK